MQCLLIFRFLFAVAQLKEQFRNHAAESEDEVGVVIFV